MAEIPRVRLAAAFAGLFLVAACGSSKSPAAPDTSAATSTTSASPPAASGATIAGVVTNGGSAAGMAMRLAVGGIRGVTITISGTGLSAMTDSSGHFSISGVPGGQVTVQFSGPATGTLTLDDVGEHDSIEVEVHVQNGEVQDEQAEDNNGAEAQLEGKIVSANPGAHTFLIGQVTVMVPSSATIRHGNQTLTFSNLIAGARVHVKGSLAGSTLNATRIEVQQSGTGGPGNGNGGNGNGNGGNGNGNSGNGNSGNGNGGDGNGDDGNDND